VSGAPLPKGARAPERVMWVDGELLRGAEAALSAWDRGARDGEGLFETVRVMGGAPVAWELHLERLVLSAAILGFPVPAAPAALRRALDEVLAAEGLRDAVARLTITRGIPGGRPVRAGAWLEAEPLSARRWPVERAGGARAVISRVPFEPGPLGAHKTTSRLAYSLARDEARVAGADEALLAAADGELLEGAVSNLFVARGATLLTPPLARGILPGTMRRRVLASCAALGLEAREARLTREDLAAADEAFVTNAVQGVVRIATLDGAPLGDAGVAARLDAARDAAERRPAG
jgi:branched-subunit amino acid aminotransferase/4-amino-4-deoxychorismate lyase